MAKKPIDVATLRHDAARRKNIPTAEFESVMRTEDKTPLRVAYERRNRDLDPQLVWRGKDEQDRSPLVVAAPPLYIQEKVHPQVIIEDLRRQSQEREGCARRSARPVRRLQWPHRLRGRYRVLPALVELDDLRGQPVGDGQPRQARGAARAGAVHMGACDDPGVIRAGVICCA